jgi:hypothetical protein
MEVKEEFMLQVSVDSNGCWNWTGALHSGYGVFKSHRAHRISYALFKDEIPRGMHIDHLCSNRACVNPDHLEAVTQGENNRRTIQRGRRPKHHKPRHQVINERQLQPENNYMPQLEYGIRLSDILGYDDVSITFCGRHIDR